MENLTLEILKNDLIELMKNLGASEEEIKAVLFLMKGRKVDSLKAAQEMRAILQKMECKVDVWLPNIAMEVATRNGWRPLTAYH